MLYAGNCLSRGGTVEELEALMAVLSSLANLERLYLHNSMSNSGKYDEETLSLYPLPLPRLKVRCLGSQQLHGRVSL